MLPFPPQVFVPIHKIQNESGLYFGANFTPFDGLTKVYVANPFVKCMIQHMPFWIAKKTLKNKHFDEKFKQGLN